MSHLFSGGNAAPAVGDDVSHLFSDAGGLYDPNRKPASTEDFAPSQRDVSVGNLLWNAAKSIPGGIVDTVKMAYNDQRPEDVALGPGRVLAPLMRAAASGAKSEAGKTAADVGRGRYSEAAGHALATAVPLVGPAAAQAGEDIGSGDTERIERGGGAALGMIASSLAPTVLPRVAPPLASIGEQMIAKGKALPAAVTNATRGINPIVLDIAGELVGQAVGAHLGVPTLARRLLGHVLESTKKGVSNKGGRVVQGSKLTDEAALANVLDELRAVKPETPTRTTLPPQPTLPPGYTPRATAPRELTPALAEPGQVSLGPDALTTPAIERRGAARVDSATEDALYAASRADRERMAAKFKQTSPAALENQRMAAARAETHTPKTANAPTKSVPAAERKRAYFLKPVEDVAGVAEEAVTPSGSITPENLPASWRSHTGQDIFPTTGAEGKALAEALKAELKDRGVSVGEAMARVSSNRAIPTRERAQLIRALNQAYAQR